VSDGFHHNQVFGSWTLKPNPTHIKRHGPSNALLFKRQGTEDDVGVNAARLVTYKEHSRLLGKGKGIPASGNVPEPGTAREETLPALFLKPHEGVYIPCQARTPQQGSRYAANNRVRDTPGL
jgi:hypothetical protein